MKIVITGGGTGGHIYPALAVCQKLQSKKHDLVWIGSRKSMESDIVPREGIEFHGIFTGKLRRYFDLRNLLDAFRIFYGFLQSRTLLKQIKPDIVFSKGGYVAVPVAIAARTLGIPVITHESDATPGLATRLLVRLSGAQLCASFESIQKYFPHREVVVTGTPVAQHFFKTDPISIRSEFRIARDEPLIVVIGGSQGALGINKLIWSSLAKILPYTHIIHQTGQISLHDAEETESQLPEDIRPRYHIRANFPHSDFADLLSAANIVISRSGANALAELAAVGAPSILIPLPTAGSRGDQLDNAGFLADNDAALVCPQEKTSSQVLSKKIIDLLSNKRKRQELSLNISKLAEPDSVNRIVKLIETVRKP